MLSQPMRAAGGGRKICDTEVVCEREESVVGGPELRAADESGSEEVNVYPACAAAVKLPGVDECSHFTMRNHWQPGNVAVFGQPLFPTTFIAYQELTENQFVARHLVPKQQCVQLGRVRRRVGEEPNPDGSIDQHHQATRLRFGDGGSRRLGTS